MHGVSCKDVIGNDISATDTKRGSGQKEKKALLNSGGESEIERERERQEKEEWVGKLKLAQHSREGHGGVCSGAFVIVACVLNLLMRLGAGRERMS
ncbi:hypothetical protein VNO78_08385 [Psophocarpus tetragonolobus]|uniref:Uncharacterized protein n=1 Tax=Psophocarpus tetragonolobus TaxID=3891 RepID=A0AAN9SXW7_PSOTE